MASIGTSARSARPTVRLRIFCSRAFLRREVPANQRFPPQNDRDWHEFATLEIGPHPGLSEDQRKIIALDYGMRGGKAKIHVRKALLYYTLRRLGLDRPPTGRPQDQQIVLLQKN
jgi:hypothetical protein